MRITVKYFGMIADWMAATEAKVTVSGNTVTALRVQLETECDKLKGISYQVAVNQSIAEQNAELNENDEVAILPPFAGG